MSDIAIAFEDGPFKARYSAKVEGVKDEGELTIWKVLDTLIIADPTFVPDTLRDKGIAQAMVERLIADAREKGQPDCAALSLCAGAFPETP